MIVEYRNGWRQIIVGSYLLGVEGFEYLSKYNDDMTHKQLKDFDIVKIYEIAEPMSLKILFTDTSDRYIGEIWNRDYK